MTVFLAFMLGGLGTYLSRASFVGILGASAIPKTIERNLRYVAPSVFAAIVVSNLAMQPPDGSAGQTSRIIAALIAGAVVAKTRSVPIMLTAGMVVLWLADWLAH